jgi:predicted O-methyltransferase YrrM
MTTALINGYPESYLDLYRPGSTEPWTVGVVVALAKALQPTHILETGTFQGLTTRALSDALPNAHITTIESDPSRIASLPALGDNVTVVCADALSWIRAYTGPKFGLVFVDDSHDANHVSTELDALYNPAQPYTSKMAPHGLICCHDVCGHFGLGGVVSAHHGFTLWLPLLHVAGGLGLIQIP